MLLVGLGLVLAWSVPGGAPGSGASARGRADTLTIGAYSVVREAFHEADAMGNRGDEAR